MWHHSDTITTYLKDIETPTVLEIGVCEGKNTRLLLPFISKKEGLLIGVDPGDPKFGLFDKCDPAYSKNWQLIRARSLEVIPTLDHEFNCVLLDGDHNYFTVYNELNLLKDKMAEEGFLFIHDVASYYCAFEDFYYDINSIPFEFRSPTGRIYPGTKNAPRNRNYKKKGVLNAVLDFLKINKEFVPIYFTWKNKGLLILQKCSEKNISKAKRINLRFIPIILKIMMRLRVRIPGLNEPILP